MSPGTGEDDRARGDRALLLALLLVLAAAASLTPIRSYDYWWHLATGRMILEQRTLPHVDPFSLTSSGTPWVDHEWLFQIVAVLGHRGLGPAALVLLKSAGVILITLLAFAHVRREGHSPAGAVLLILPSLLGSAFRLDVRPEIATLFLVPRGLFLVLRARAAGTTAPLALVPLLVALGANLHVGILILPPLLALGALVTLICDRLGSRPGFAARLFLTAGASALAAAANPYGFRIYAVPLELERILSSLPSPNLEWARPAPAQFPLFYAAAAALLLLVALCPRRIDPLATPATLLLAGLGAAHLRNVGLFFLVLPLGAARPARALLDRATRAAAPKWAARLHLDGATQGRFRPAFVTAAVLLVVAVPALPILPPGIVWGLGIASDNEPSRAVDFLEREGVGKRLFNDVRFGGYLIWRRYPGHRVFIDGRNEIHASLLREVFAALKDSRAWEALLDRYQIDAAFLRYPPTLQKVVIPSAGGAAARETERAFATVYFPKERWALVYWDDDAMVLLRRSSEYESVIARLEYRAVHPDDWRYLAAGLLSRHLSVGPILEELRRKVAEEPGCERARGLLAYFSRLAASLPGIEPGKGPEGE